MLNEESESSLTAAMRSSKHTLHHPDHYKRHRQTILIWFYLFMHKLLWKEKMYIINKLIIWKQKYDAVSFDI